MAPSLVSGVQMGGSIASRSFFRREENEVPKVEHVCGRCAMYVPERKGCVEVLRLEGEYGAELSERGPCVFVPEQFIPREFLYVPNK